jgi:hypothetical protein
MPGGRGTVDGGGLGGGVPPTRRGRTTAGPHGSPATGGGKESERRKDVSLDDVLTTALHYSFS